VQIDHGELDAILRHVAEVALGFSSLRPLPRLPPEAVELELAADLYPLRGDGGNLARPSA
jgi:hypothetical protein